METDLHNTHLLLVAGQDYESCRDHVLHFFDRTILVKYDRLTITRDSSFSAAEDGFRPRLEAGLGLNRQLLRELVAELAQAGFGELDGWQKMPQGYLSKTLHEAAHLLDGFFGIHSAFYNLIEDSHWVSPTLREEINSSPTRYWLLRADGSSQVTQADRVPFLRRYGRE